MAKKVVASLKKENAKGYSKIIKAVKNDNGSYSFKEEIVPSDMVQEILNKENKENQ